MSIEKIKIYKIGGSTLDSREAVTKIVKSLKELIKTGDTALVHGGGPAISSWFERVGIEPEFVNGQRLTDLESAEVVEMVLSGLVNKELVSVLQSEGIAAAGISGRDGKLAVAKVLDKKLGRVGEVTKVNPVILKALLEGNIMPVISPVCEDSSGVVLNVNADYFAVELAAALKASELNFITSVGGVLKGEDMVEELNPESAEELIKEGTITEGMIPKIEASIKAVENGVDKVQIMDHRGVAGTVIKL